MKKQLYIISIFFFFICINTFSQDEKNIRLHLTYPTDSTSEIKESYAHGDSITTEYFKKCSLTLLNKGNKIWKKEGDPYLEKCEFFVYYQGSVMQNKNIKTWEELQNKYKEMPEKITIAWIYGCKIVDGKKVSFYVPNTTIYRAVGLENKKAAKALPK